MTKIFMPISPPCSCQDCRAISTHWLIAPDGERNPGGWVCKAHGESIVQEFSEKIDEQWTLMEITNAEGDYQPLRASSVSRLVIVEKKGKG